MSQNNNVKVKVKKASAMKAEKDSAEGVSNHKDNDLLLDTESLTKEMTLNHHGNYIEASDSAQIEATRTEKKPTSKDNSPTIKELYENMLEEERIKNLPKPVSPIDILKKNGFRVRKAYYCPSLAEAAELIRPEKWKTESELSYTFSPIGSYYYGATSYEPKYFHHYEGKYIKHIRFEGEDYVVEGMVVCTARGNTYSRKRDYFKKKLADVELVDQLENDYNECISIINQYLFGSQEMVEAYFDIGKYKSGCLRLFRDGFCSNCYPQHNYFIFKYDREEEEDDAVIPCDKISNEICLNDESIAKYVMRVNQDKTKT